jgi:hypothetical protein
MTDTPTPTPEQLRERAIQIIQTASFESYPFSDEDQLLLADAMDFSCTSASDFVNGGTMVKDLNALLKRVTEFYTTPKKAIKDVAQIFQDMQNRDGADITTGKNLVSVAIADWKREQDRIDAENRRKAQEAADREAAAERQRRLDELDRKRATAPDPAVAKMFEAAAVAIQSTPAVARSVDVPSSVPRVAGLSFRKNWYGKVDDLKTLLSAVVRGEAPIPEEVLIDAIESHLNSVAASLRDNLGNVYPGCSAYESDTPVGRSR